MAEAVLELAQAAFSKEQQLLAWADDETAKLLFCLAGWNVKVSAQVASSSECQMRESRSAINMRTDKGSSKITMLGNQKTLNTIREEAKRNNGSQPQVWQI